MPREFVSGVRFAQVSTLPAAASSAGLVFEQGGKLWFSNGTTWQDLGAAGSGPNTTLLTLLENASLAMRNNVRTRGTIPASLAPTITVGTSTAPSLHTRVYTFGDTGHPFVSSGGRPTTSSGRTTFPVVTPSSTRIDFCWRVETVVDSDSVAFLLDSVTADGYRFIVDGQYVSETSTTSAAGSQRYYRLQWATKARRKVIVEGNPGLGFWGSAVPDDGQCILPEDGDGLRMFYVGDSNPYLQGFNQKGDSYGIALGDFLGIRDSWVNAISATGFVVAGGGNNYAGRRADWTTLPANSVDLLVFQLSYNDYNASVADATLQAAVTTELTQARAAHPNAVIIVHGNNSWNDSGGSIAGLSAHETAAAAAVTAFADPLVAFLPIYTATGQTLPITGQSAPGDTGTGNTPRYVNHAADHMSPAGNIYFAEWLARRFIDLFAEMAGVQAPSLAPPPPASAGGSSVWTRITGATTAVAGTPYLAVITAATDVTLPAFTAGQRFVVMNSRDSTAAVRVVVGAGNTINHPAFATGDNITCQPGESISLVAESATELDLVSTGAIGPTGPAGPQGPSDRTLHTGAFEQFPIQSAAVATPSAGFGRIYMRERAGRVTLETLGPSGVDNALQPALYNNRVMILAPNTTTSVTAQGISATTAATLSHPALATTSLAASLYRTRCQTSTTAGNAAGIRHSVATMLRGNATALGGFYFHARVCSGSLALAGGEAFVGLSSSVAALAGAPSALADCVGLVKDVADTAWQFVRRTGTGTAQKVALTTPLTYATLQVIDVIIFSRPNGTGLGCVVRSFNNAGVPTTHLDTEYTDNLPAAGTLLAGRFDIRNGATAAAADFELVRMYAESDF